MFDNLGKKQLESSISVIFEEGTQIDRVAEAIELLACFFGDDLHIIRADTLPPDASHYYKKAA